MWIWPGMLLPHHGLVTDEATTGVGRTWPPDWEARRAGVNCLACREGRPDEIPPGRRFFAGSVSDAYLFRDDAAPGYTALFWRGRHVVEPTDLDDAEAGAFWAELMAVSRAIEAIYRPAKLNYFWLGNSMPHLHVHVVPRHLHDPDPGRPPRFMMVDRDWPLLPAAEYERQLESLRVRLVAPLASPFADLTVEPATETDLAEVQDLLTAVAHRLRSRGIDMWPEPFPMARIREGFDRGHVYVVRDGPRIVATQSVADVDPFWGDLHGNALYAHRLAIADGYKGLGAALLRWTEDLALACGRSLIRLDCHAGNRALRDYYERAGYRHCSDLDGNGWTVSLYEKALCTNGAMS